MDFGDLALKVIVLINELLPGHTPWTVRRACYGQDTMVRVILSVKVHTSVFLLKPYCTSLSLSRALYNIFAIFGKSRHSCNTSPS